MLDIQPLTAEKLEKACEALECELVGTTFMLTGTAYCNVTREWEEGDEGVGHYGGWRVDVEFVAMPCDGAILTREMLAQSGCVHLWEDGEADRIAHELEMSE